MSNTSLLGKASRMDRKRNDAFVRRGQARSLRAAAWALQSLCVVTALGLQSGCGGDEASPALDGDRLGDLSGSQLRSLCEEGRREIDGREPPVCDGDEFYANVQVNLSSCDESLLAPCDVTAGELRACRRAALADPCAERPEDTAAACAPLFQRGCAEDPPPPRVAECPGLPALVAPFEGIYEIVRHSRNTEGCGAEGASVINADAQRFFVVVTLQLSGAPLGWLESCEDLEGCRAAARELRQYSQRLSALQSATELSVSLTCHPALAGALSSSGIGGGGTGDSNVCSVEQVTRALTRAEDGSLRLESQTATWEKPAEDGDCSFSAADIAPSGTPCSEREVYEARFASTP
jgi:hypothetical protein